jgi:hypothetical protein
LMLLLWPLLQLNCRQHPCSNSSLCILLLHALPRSPCCTWGSTLLRPRQLLPLLHHYAAPRIPVWVELSITAPPVPIQA